MQIIQFILTCKDICIHATKYHSSPNEYIWGKNKFSSHFQIMDIKANQHCHYFVSMSANCVSYTVFLCFIKKVFSLVFLYNFRVIYSKSFHSTWKPSSLVFYRSICRLRKRVFYYLVDWHCFYVVTTQSSIHFMSNVKVPVKDTPFIPIC